MLSLLQNKCPRCHKGTVFKSANPFKKSFAEMHNHCPVCRLNYNNEQGFYWGAMYVSYGLTLIESILTYIIARLCGIGVYDYNVLWPILAVIIIMSPVNFRLSRLIWLYLFGNK
jgi:hypothetical protein